MLIKIENDNIKSKDSNFLLKVEFCFGEAPLATEIGRVTNLFFGLCRLMFNLGCEV